MSSPALTSASRLADLVGAENVIADPGALAAYAADGIAPTAAVRAGTAEEASEVIRYAAATKLSVIACGARTKFGIGAPPARYDLALDLTRLDRIIAYDPGDLTLSVEAGIGLEKLGETLRAQGQMLPLAVPWMARTTAGGTLASGVDSPLRQAYGTARDFVLGMEFVTGDGTTARSGGRVVKNVAGYDLHKLFLGSIGTLGAITRVNFRTFPFPAESQGFVGVLPSSRAALALRQRIVQSPLRPLTLEILDPQMSQVFLDSAPPDAPGLAAPKDWLSRDGWTLATAFWGSDTVKARYARELSEMAEECGATQARVLNDAERPLVWHRLREAIPTLLATSPAATILKLTVLPTRMNDLMGHVRGIPERLGLPSAVLARGCGVVYAALLPPAKEEDTLVRLEQAATGLFHAVVSAHGRAAVPWCPAGLKQAIRPFGPPGEDLPLMQKVKHAFDPLGLFAPGRFYGGL